MNPHLEVHPFSFLTGRAESGRISARRNNQQSAAAEKWLKTRNLIRLGEVFVCLHSTHCLIQAGYHGCRHNLRRGSEVNESMTDGADIRSRYHRADDKRQQKHD